MEEMRGVAMAYYANMSQHNQQLVLGFYRSIDVNGDGRVSIQEFLAFLVKGGMYRHVQPDLFKLLDKNNDGYLDFEECVTFHYMIKAGRLVICDGCKSYLWGLHFLCVECYNRANDTFDLCCSCYHNKNFKHVHSSESFLDNYALLRTKPWQGNTSAVVDILSKRPSYTTNAVVHHNRRNPNLASVNVVHHNRHNHNLASEIAQSQWQQSVSGSPYGGNYQPSFGQSYMGGYGAPAPYQLAPNPQMSIPSQAPQVPQVELKQVFEGLKMGYEIASNNQAAAVANPALVAAAGCTIM